MASSVVPDRFEGGDFDQWLHHFDRCAVANGWANAARLIRLPAFLKGPAATFYESLAEESKDTYAHLTESLRTCFKPSVNRESYYEEFYSQALRPSENPSLFLWRLQELLRTAEPDLSDDTFNALLRRQFMHGLPRDLKLKLLESDPTPDLDTMVQFAQRFRALDALPQPQATYSATAAQPLPQTIPVDLQRLDRLEKMVHEIAANQTPIVTAVRRNSSTAQSTSCLRCFLCGEIGHVVRSCARRRREKQCTVCGGWGHRPEVCGSSRRLNPAGQNDGHSQLMDNRTVQNSMCKSLPLNFQGVPRY